MIIDCHVHAGELGKHYPVWWIEELYRVWGGVHQWTYDRPDMSVGERLVYQMDRLGIDMMCIMTSRKLPRICADTGSSVWMSAIGPLRISLPVTGS